MKFSLSWLRDHLDSDAPLDRITTTLSSIGLEVESVIDRAAPLAPFRTARIIEAKQHPDADRLRVCRVDAGTGDEISVVCGAANARTGLHAVFAPPGAFIPGSCITLKIGKIRGVNSAGMLVSAREMALGDDHEGIIELPEGTPVGLPYAAWAGLDDPVIEIGVTPNRGDALAVRGIARDLAAAGLGTLKPWSPARVPSVFETSFEWQIDWPEACPWVLGRSVRGVTNRASPDWLQRRLAAIGLRPISALVDITNFFAIDLGRPMHVFDADRLAGSTLTLRRGAGENFRALNGRDITVDGEDLVIADASGAVSLAGIMGGADSGTQDGTTSVFIECALFDPVIVARAGRRVQIASDARARFERGVDQAMPPAALEAATRMILDLCGGEAGTVVSAGAEPAWRRQASLRLERLAGLGGSTLADAEATAILERLGFTASPHGNDRIVVDVPPWRNDVAGSPGLDQAPTLDPARAQTAAEGAAVIEPECDLVEEVLRIAGLDTIPPVSLPRLSAIPGTTLSPRQSRAALARRVLAARGLAECVSYSFGARAVLADFGAIPKSLTLRNPIAADLDQMRPTPLATLAPIAARNIARSTPEAALFEIGPGFSDDGQQSMAVGLRVGAPARHWPASPEQADAARAKADLWAAMAAIGVPLDALSLTCDAPAHYHPGQSATVRQGPRTVLARFGALHPALLSRLNLPVQAAAFELFLDAVPDPKRRRRAAPDLPALHPVFRDFAFVVPQDVPADAVLKAARSADRALIAKVGLFDVYVGANVIEGHKSLGIEVTFQPHERTLTEAEIDAACARVVQSVSKVSGARLR